MIDESKSAPTPDPVLQGPSGKHYPALDGLRGVAILLVLLFHGFLELAWTTPSYASLAAWPKAGWVGVDIFFVLSGFLITGILLDSRGSSHYFRNFYLRRTLRILPVYYLLLAIVFFVLPWIVAFDSDGLKTILARQAWLWTHLTNMSFVYYGKVWTAAQWLNLTHLWSLAIEEQFYLLWPVAVLYLDRRKLKWTCLAFMVASFLLRFFLWQLGQRNGALYFPTPCRLDGLAMGALVAILVREGHREELLRTCSRAIGTIAAAMLAILVFVRGGLVFTDQPTVVFGTTLVSLCTACAILSICLPQAGTWLTAPLQGGFLRMTGRVSYGLYLLHAPLLAPALTLLPPEALAKATGSELCGNLVFVSIYMGLSYALALISWQAYEKQWLKLRRHLH